MQAYDVKHGDIQLTQFVDDCCPSCKPPSAPNPFTTHARDLEPAMKNVPLVNGGPSGCKGNLRRSLSEIIGKAPKKEPLPRLDSRLDLDGGDSDIRARAAFTRVKLCREYMGGGYTGVTWGVGCRVRHRSIRPEDLPPKLLSTCAACMNNLVSRDGRQWIDCSCIFIARCLLERM